MEQIVIAHISDLHIQENIFSRSVHPVGGWRGHDFLLCKRLKNAFAHIRTHTQLESSEDLHVIVSGDLTRVGRPGDFAAAQFFLRGKRPLDLDYPVNGHVGLELPSYRLLCIPGNHDHWNKQLVPAGHRNPGLFPSEFPRTPWHRCLMSPAHSLALDVYGLDSNSGLRGVRGRVDAVRAAGRISERELDHLKRLLSAPVKASHQAPHRMKVILVHHPFSIPVRIVTAAQPLHPLSSMAILNLAWKHKVSAILNGHTHELHVEPFSISGGPEPHTVWELRCPTTLQAPSTPGVQGFLVHQLMLIDNQPVWNVWQYIWSESRGFLSERTPLVTIP